ncbi:MAG: hypothetical protein FJZ58_07415 [Chlamydiae bacterium]|nr:hypothetical protein [Chlamydiota bacterium]
MMYISYPLLNNYLNYNPRVPTPHKSSSIECIRSLVGGWIRNTFFLPLFRSMSQQHVERLQEEEDFTSTFWSSSHETFPNIPHHQEIKNIFQRTIKQISVPLDGKTLSVSYACISSRQGQAPYYNCLYVLGQFSTVYNDAMSSYPLLVAYVKAKEKDPNLPPARFFLVSQYNTVDQAHPNTPYKPSTFSELGRILSSIARALAEEWKEPLDHVLAHSIGCMVCIAALKYWSRNNLPRQFFLDRGPSSVLHLSSLFWGGRLCLPLASWTGWNPDFGNELYEFLQTASKSHQVVLFAVKQDHIFPGLANLSTSEQVQILAKQKKINLLTFSFPLQYIHHYALHSLGHSHFAAQHLTTDCQKQTFLLQQENLAEAIIRHGILHRENSSTHQN